MARHSLDHSARALTIIRCSSCRLEETQPSIRWLDVIGEYLQKFAHWLTLRMITSLGPLTWNDPQPHEEYEGYEAKSMKPRHEAKQLKV